MKINKHQIPGYKILDVIATGGMGTVFKAHQSSLDKTVALKLLSPKLARDESYVERFVREARSLARLNHPNVVTVIDVGNSGGHYYLVMELVEGRSLANMIDEDGALAEKEALSIIRSIACALVHAQDNNLIHRDIKPDNILISKDEICKLCDLGLARPSGASTSLTAAGVAIGTPEYIAPEQARGESELDIRTDIYSLGATLYETVTGETPFEGPTPAHIMRAHIDQPLKFPDTPKLSGGVRSLIEKMMSKEPAGRQQSAKELLDDIDLVLTGGMVKSAATRRSSGVYSGIPEVVKKNFALLACAAGAAVVAILLLAFLVPAPSQAPEEDSVENTQDAQPRQAGIRRRIIEDGPAPETEPEKQHRTVSLPASEAQRAFESIKEIEDAGLTEPDELVRLYREMAEKYAETVWADKALERILKIEKSASASRNIADEEYRKLSSEASESLEQRRYHDAILMLARFCARHPGTPAADKARRLADQFVASAARYFANTCRRAAGLANHGEYDKARDLLASLEKTGISELDDIVAEKLQQVSQHQNRSASEREKARKNALYGEFLDMLLEKAMACDMTGALQAIVEARSSGKFALISDKLAREERDLHNAMTVIYAAEAGLATRTGRTEQLKYRNGSAIWGKIIKVENGRVSLTPQGESGQAAAIEISELEDRQIVNFAAFSQKPASELAKFLFFMARGNAAEASASMPQANLTPSEKERLQNKLDLLRNLADEKGAEELASQVESTYKSRRFATTAALARKLYEKYSHTGFLVENAASLGRYIPQNGLLRIHSKLSSFKTPISADTDALPSFMMDKSLCDARSTIYVRWEGLLNLLEDGEYTFHIMSSGPVKMELEGRSILRMNPETELEVSSVSKKLRKGATDFKLEATCKKGEPIILHLFWQRDGGARMPLTPTDVCYLPARKDEYKGKLK